MTRSIKLKEGNVIFYIYNYFDKIIDTNDKSK